MNTVSLRRFWLTWRWDIAAAVAVVVFCVTAFWAAGTCSAVLRAL